MDAKELRIGNWVKAKGSGEEQISWGITYIKYLNQWQLDARPLDDFEGIPLTPEWLEGLGFEKTKHSWVMDSWAVRLEDGVLKLYNDKNAFTCDYITECDCFVHKLQNLYFALTGQELEIKEKV